MGKFLIMAGVILIIAGVIISYRDRLPFLGKLPGDFSIERPNFSFHFPLMTSIIISLLLSLIIFLVNKYRN